MNLRNWNHWVRYIFASAAAASKPWRATGQHPMTWASYQLTLHVRKCEGGWEPTVYDYNSQRVEDPEEALLRAEDEMIARNLEATRPVLDREVIRQYGRRPRIRPVSITIDNKPCTFRPSAPVRSWRAAA